jgi:hypothetical protein
MSAAKSWGGRNTSTVHYCGVTMNITFTIDWLSCTGHDEVVSLPRLLVPYHPMRDFLPCKALFGYREAFQNGAGALVMFAAHNPVLGQHMIYSGGALNRYAAVAITWYDIIRHHEKRKDVCKRIDLAFDAHDSALDISQLHHELQHDPDVATVRKFSRITSNDGGDTLYIGARSSEAMLRIYDKAVETNTPGDWKRIELELKGSKAKKASVLIADEGADSASTLAKLWGANLVHFKSSVWREIMQSDSLPFGKSKPDKHDTATWLLEQVAPAFGRYLARTPNREFVKQFLAAVDTYEKMTLSGKV